MASRCCLIQERLPLRQLWSASTKCSGHAKTMNFSVISGRRSAASCDISSYRTIECTYEAEYHEAWCSYISGRVICMSCCEVMTGRRCCMQAIRIWHIARSVCWVLELCLVYVINTERAPLVCYSSTREVKSVITFLVDYWSWEISIHIAARMMGRRSAR